MEDNYNLQRFVEAQNENFEDVLNELESGRKQSHWMWYIFPQIKGLGKSKIAEKFAISSREEAVAYLNHPILGARLRECTQLINAIEGVSIERVFSHPDNLKFHSSMTLFMVCSKNNTEFEKAINKYFEGKVDTLTLDMMRSVESFKMSD